MNSLRLAVIFACIALASNADEKTAGTNQPLMTREQARHVLDKVDPYSTNAMKSLVWHMKQDYAKQRPALEKRKMEQLAQLDLELLHIRPHMGEPPRSGPWPEEQFQALLKKQAELKKAQPAAGASGGEDMVKPRQ